MSTKVALVTGGSRGLGRDMALSLAKKGIDVILTYHTNKDEADKVVAQIEALNCKAMALAFDASNFKMLQSFVAQVSEILITKWNTDKFDYLINNAGIGATLPIPAVTEEAFDNLVNIHYKSVYFLTQKCFPLLNNNGGVVFISTGTTRVCVPGYSVYSSLKGAIEIFTKYVAKELGHKGIRANVVAPGPIETDFNNAAIRNSTQMQERVTANAALGRVGHADDIGSVVAFLCSDDAKWISGQRIEVSGGMAL